MPFTKVVITYRPNGGFSLGSLAKVGPNRRNHSIQHADRPEPGLRASRPRPEQIDAGARTQLGTAR